MFSCPISVALNFANGRVFVSYRYWWSGFMRLASRSVHGHYPQMTLILVLRCEDYVIPFTNGVEEVPVKVNFFLSTLSTSSIIEPLTGTCYKQKENSTSS